MIGSELIKWIHDNNAEDLLVIMTMIMCFRV